MEPLTVIIDNVLLRCVRSKIVGCLFIQFEFVLVLWPKCWLRLCFARNEAAVLSKTSFNQHIEYINLFLFILAAIKGQFYSK